MNQKGKTMVKHTQRNCIHDIGLPAGTSLRTGADLVVSSVRLLKALLQHAVIVRIAYVLSRPAFFRT